VAEYFEDYVRAFNLPVRTGVEVKSAVRNSGRPGFTIETTEGVIEAQRIVAATGPFQKPVIPRLRRKRAAFIKSTRPILQPAAAS
jgi:putative flavoprotein involved in K+ transport